MSSLNHPGSPSIPSQEQRVTEATQASAALDALNPKDPVVRALLSRIQEQLLFVANPDAEIVPELSPEQVQTLSALKSCHKRKENGLQTGLNWAEVEAKLQKSPEKLAILARLIARGGEPTVTAKLSNGNFRFDELSEESPRGHRGDSLFEYQLKSIGAELMEPDVYDSFRGKVRLDYSTWSRLRGSGFYGHRNKSGYRYSFNVILSEMEKEVGVKIAFMQEDLGSGSHYLDHLEKVGFRCSVEV